MAPAAHSWHQPLADYPPQCVCQARADLLLFVGFEHAQYAVNGLTGIYCMKCAEDQMAGLRRAEGDLYRFTIAHFADENDFGGLTQRGAKAVRKSVEVGAQLAL